MTSWVEEVIGKVLWKDGGFVLPCLSCVSFRLPRLGNWYLGMLRSDCMENGLAFISSTHCLSKYNHHWYQMGHPHILVVECILTTHTKDIHKHNTHMYVHEHAYIYMSEQKYSYVLNSISGQLSYRSDLKVSNKLYTQSPVMLLDVRIVLFAFMQGLGLILDLSALDLVSTTSSKFPGFFSSCRDSESRCQEFSLLLGDFAFSPLNG